MMIRIFSVLFASAVLLGCAQQDNTPELTNTSTIPVSSTSQIADTHNNKTLPLSAANKFVEEWNASNFQADVFLEGTNCKASSLVEDGNRVFLLSGTLRIDPIDSQDINVPVGVVSSTVHWAAIDISKSSLFDEMRWDVVANGVKIHGKILFPYSGSDDDDVEFEYEPIGVR